MMSLESSIVPTSRRNDAHDNRSRRTAEGRGSRNARERREERTHAVQCEVLNLADALRRTRKDEIPDRDTAGVKPHDERRDRSRWHERTRAIHIADRLRHRLAHVRAGMKRQLQQADVLDGFRFHSLYAGDVEEVILVVVDKVPFHLRGRYSAVRLRHIDHRQIQVRENIDGHPRERENRTQGHADHQNDDRDGIAKGTAQEPHGYFAPCAASCSDCKNGPRSPWAAATDARFCQTASRANASSISACTRKLCESATSTSVARPA